MHARLTRAVVAGSVASLAMAMPAMAAAPRTLADVEIIHTLNVPGTTLFGWAVSELADITGDGRQELIVADDAQGPGVGRVFVFDGASGAQLFVFDEGPGLRLGYSIADAGDVNADGKHDIIAGAPGVHAAFVYSGATGEKLLTLSGSGTDRAGVAVATAGDVNRDGRADVLVGASSADVNGTDTGRAFVFSGADGSLLHAIDGGAPGDLFGTATDSVADMNGDGIPEHAIGARDAGKWDRGAVSLFDGATGTLMWRFPSPKEGSELGSFFVAGLPDLTGDGVADVYAGDYAAGANGNQSGVAYVLSGATGQPAQVHMGDDAHDGMGPGREAGDVDGDGTVDLIVGSWISRDGAKNGGRVDLFSGADGSTLGSIVGTVPGATLGFDAVGVGDVDGDGVPDVAVAAGSANVVYVISGASLLS